MVGNFRESTSSVVLLVIFQHATIHSYGQIPISLLIYTLTFETSAAGLPGTTGSTWKYIHCNTLLDFVVRRTESYFVVPRSTL